jgi:hypothetical protein
MRRLARVMIAARASAPSEAAIPTAPLHARKKKRYPFGTVAGQGFEIDRRTVDRCTQSRLQRRQIGFDLRVEGHVNQPGQRQVQLCLRGTDPRFHQRLELVRRHRYH